MIRDPETLNALLDAVNRFVRERLVPAEALVAETDEIPADIVREMKELGLFGLTVPEEYGGLGVTMEEEVMVMLAMGQTSPCFRSLFGTTVGIGSQGILFDGTRGAEEEVPAAPGHRRADRLVRAHGAGCGFRRRVAAHHGHPRRRPLRGQRHQALHHQRAACRHLHADGAHQSRGQGRRRRVGLHRRRRTRPASPSARRTRRWASAAPTPPT